MAFWPPISRDDIKQAADLDGFASVLPQLVRRLIAETTEGLTELEMPGEGGVSIGGFDGVVTAARATIEVPAGTSVWELSVEKSVSTKADSDYSKRLVGPEGHETADVTYVQLILRTWAKASAWAAERSGESRWKQVRAMNLDAVTGWLDRAPGTAVWLAEHLGKAVADVRLADDWFDRTWLPSTRLPLGPDLVLAGRGAAGKALLALLIRSRPFITVTGDLGADEFRAFIAAAVKSVADQERETLRSRVLFVKDATALARLMPLAQPLVLVLTDAALAASQPAGGPHQIVVLSPPGEIADVEVGPVDGREIAALLAAAGEPLESADRLGALARRSLSALRRDLAIRPATLRPTWADAPDVVRRRLLLLGGWNRDDRVLVERMTGRLWTDVQDIAMTLTSGSDAPMLGQLHDDWYLVSPSDAWLLLRPRMTSDDIDELRRVAVEVLTEPDLFHGLSSIEAVRAQMDGQRLLHSPALRLGLARSLALLGAEPGPVPVTGRTPGTHQARLVVRDIFTAANADQTYALWACLLPVLGELSEAAPEEFLAAMLEGLRGPDALHARMFTDDADELLGPSMGHSEFLLALETLAWAPEYFDQAVHILGVLAHLDPGGRLSNRPARSLADIFSCWHPTTAAGEQQRELALRRLLQERQGVARALLVAIISNNNPSFHMENSRPQFRDWKRKPVLTYADAIRNVRTAGALFLKDVDREPQALLTVIDKISHLAPEHRRELCDRLSALGQSLANETDRAALSEALRTVAARHRGYPDIISELPADEITLVKAAAVALAPRDLLHRHAWLFTQEWIETGDLSRHNDFKAYERHVQQLRADAVEEILDEHGLGGVEALATATQRPWLIGMALADAAPLLDAEMLRWLGQSAPRPSVAYTYLRQRFTSVNQQVVDTLLAAADGPNAKGAVLRAIGDPPSAWARMAALGDDVAQSYWQHFSVYGLGNFQPVIQGAQGLMTVGRHGATLMLMSIYLDRVDTPEGAELAAAACEGLLTTNPPDLELGALSGHSFRTIVAFLHRYQDILGTQRLINIEWQLFPALGFQADAPVLHAALAGDPALFVEVIELASRPDHETSSPPQPGPIETDNDRLDTTSSKDHSGFGDDQGKEYGADSDKNAHAQHKVMAGRAFDVLRSWRRVPGTRPDGVIDPHQLNAWVDRVRPLLVEHDRLIIGDHEIGMVLAHALPDSDGCILPRIVRDLLERVSSDEIDDGVSHGVYEIRGITSRGIFDGGDQERDLAEIYRKQATNFAAWPRTRQILCHLIDHYINEADLHEQLAERRRRGLDG